MENFFSRYKNPLVLMAVLFIQVIALATQVKRTEGGRPAAGGGTRLIRVWTVTAITPDGIVGKVKDVFPLSSSVLLITDRDSGAGVILQTSRLQGILRGSPQGFLQVNDVMSDEKVDIGEQVITSGGDGVYPKGLPVGAVAQVSPDNEGGPFLAVRIKPAAHLDKLEEVLVVTEIKEAGGSSADNSAPRRAADVLSERLPSVPKTTDANAAAPSGTSATNPPGTNRNASPSAPAATNPPNPNKNATPTAPAAPSPSGSPGASGASSTTSGTKKVEGVKPSASQIPTPTPTPTPPKPKASAKTTPSPEASPTASPTPGDNAAPSATPRGNAARPKATPSPTEPEKPPR